LGIEIIFLLLLVFALMALPIVVRRLQGPINYIMPRALDERRKAGEELVIIDVRPATDFNRGHIKDSTNVTHRYLESLIAKADGGEQYNKSVPVMVICQSDLKASRTAKMLGKNGFTDVSVVKSGVLGWKRAHLPLQSSN
jgi:rhodanese-related sulfurtransferase